MWQLMCVGLSSWRIAVPPGERFRQPSFVDQQEFSHGYASALSDTERLSKLRSQAGL
jgi:hypothetical protein